MCKIELKLATCCGYNYTRNEIGNLLKIRAIFQRFPRCFTTRHLRFHHFIGVVEHLKLLKSNMRWLQGFFPFFELCSGRTFNRSQHNVPIVEYHSLYENYRFLFLTTKMLVLMTIIKKIWSFDCELHCTYKILKLSKCVTLISSTRIVQPNFIITLIVWLRIYCRNIGNL